MTVSSRRGRCEAPTADSAAADARAADQIGMQVAGEVPHVVLHAPCCGAAASCSPAPPAPRRTGRCAVMISASPTGPATLSMLAWPAMPMAISAFRMPKTVPNRPTNGAVEPTVARNARPPEILLLTSSTARCSDMVIHSCRSMRSVRRPSWCEAARRPLLGDEAEVIALLQALDAVLERGRGPELLLDDLAGLLQLALIPQLGEDDEPGPERHEHQDDQGRAG